jgi:hypothetical protein
VRPSKRGRYRQSVINCLCVPVAEVLEVGQDVSTGKRFEPDNGARADLQALLRKEKSDIVRAYNP